MDYQQLESLRANHPAWRLLKADNAVLVASFLHRTFIAPNLRSCPESELISKLEDYIFHLARTTEGLEFRREAGAYLDDWASDRCGFLRKSYTAETDEPVYDLAPATELALTWLAGLSKRSFIGTQSRLMTIFEILRQLVHGTETDPDIRIAELQHRRAQIDAEIARINQGHIDILDPIAVRDRFQEVVTSALSLLSDFRAVEQNFRDLDREVRERIATSDAGKSELLEGVFGARDAIADSDQGRSFTGFWDLVMSEQRQEELEALLAKVLALDAVKAMAADRRIRRIHYDWIAAGEVTQRTVARLSAELRRYLDDKVWLENRRIMQILRDIEQAALAVRAEPPGERFAEIDELAPSLSLAMDRPLFSPPMSPEIDDTVSIGSGEDVPADALFDSRYVDKARLAANVWTALQRKDQVSLSEIVAACPLEQGLAELVTYLSVAASDDGAVIDDRSHQTITWTDRDGCARHATMPLVIFSRAGTLLRTDNVHAMTGLDRIEGQP